MGDQIPDHSLIYDKNSIFSWDLPCLDPKFSSKDTTIQAYMNNIFPHIINNVEVQLGMSKWHRRFFVKPPLLPNAPLSAIGCIVSLAQTAYLDGYLFGFIDEDLNKDRRVNPSKTLRFPPLSRLYLFYLFVSAAYFQKAWVTVTCALTDLDIILGTNCHDK